MEDGAMVIDLQTFMAEIESKQELESFQSQVDAPQEKLRDLKIDVLWSEDVTKMELELFWCKVGSISTILTYLKSKARNMAVTHLAHCTKHDN
ncbi:hypothetical protein AXF42_Ash015672 [Apostasia shenzhenica]|uniref:Uncharacterized protein n=1 Tax=Apostasia shenzhenica TaxID=1088818 RepID=A0A2H9ZU14_9ASPA|nr:hypothetical protein AXF42_Ash015672 [Apostasia shenzhenica]